ncbi:MAG: hypothetical protein JW704_13120, partial [Anaerolineaceae bacterium]|nr:hypothetical protein [Anaerolineaceae bacterium]
VFMLLFFLTIPSWSPLWAMSITIEDLAYRELTDEPVHLDASLHYRVVVDPDNPKDCLSYGYEDNVLLEGSLYAPEIDLSGTASYTGSLNEADQPLSWFETEVDQAFALAQQINDNDQTGGINQLFDETDNGSIELEEGLYAVDNLFLGGQTTIVLKGRVMIFSSGDVHIAGSARIHAGGDPQDLAIYSAGNIFCAGDTILNGQLYALSGEISCTDNAMVRGSLTAQTITMSGSASFEYFEDHTGQALSFGVLSVRDASGETEDRTVLFQAHKNSLLMTRQLDVENGSFIWRNSTGDDTAMEQNTDSKDPIATVKGYSEYNLLTEHRVLEKVVFGVLESPYYNIL